MPAVSSKSSRSYRANSAAGKSVMRRRWVRSSRACERLRQECDELKEQNRELRQQVRKLAGDLEIATAQAQLAPAADQTSDVLSALSERPLHGHQFAVRLIALAIELAKRIGFRATERALELVFALLGIEQKTPSHDVIEQWTMRLGVAELKDTFNKDQRVAWMADHSSQIGKEKVLLIIGIAIEDIPPAGETLSLDRMKVLAIVPGTNWKKEHVHREYQRLAARIGAPVYLLCDGATELREPAASLEKDGKPTIVLGDLKHHAANLLEKEIGRSDTFKRFLSEVGLTRNRVQQTELSHFAPPALKQKSRFMNLGPLLNWSEMVLYHLDHPESQACRGIAAERIEEKLGWLRTYRQEIAQWRDCQGVIDQSLWLINHHGLQLGTADKLAELLAPWCGAGNSGSPASKLGHSLLAWVRQSGERLHAGDRVWLSTEVLESLFGRYKRLERQHSRGGFTRLLAALPSLCREVTGALVRKRFGEVNSKSLREWIQETLGTTLTSRRNRAYREAGVRNCVHV